jgi:hypothetical protein
MAAPDRRPGPFALVDAAATVSTRRARLAVTLVNRNRSSPETADLVLRDLAFGGEAQIRCVTAERDPASRILPDVEGAFLEQWSQSAVGQAYPSPCRRGHSRSSRRRCSSDLTLR